MSEEHDATAHGVRVVSLTAENKHADRERESSALPMQQVPQLLMRAWCIIHPLRKPCKTQVDKCPSGF